VDTLLRVYIIIYEMATPKEEEEEDYDDNDNGDWCDASDEEDLDNAGFYDRHDHYFYPGKPMYGNSIKYTIASIQCEIYSEKAHPKPKSYHVTKK
jgi:hypothetical protein